MLNFEKKLKEIEDRFLKGIKKSSKAEDNKKKFKDTIKNINDLAKDLGDIGKKDKKNIDKLLERASSLEYISDKLFEKENFVQRLATITIMTRDALENNKLIKKGTIRNEVLAKTIFAAIAILITEDFIKITD